MLQQLQLTNFKSFAGESDPIPFAPVTILVGANASGKSNVFDAIRFLQGIGMGLSIAEILTGKWEGGREVYPPLRGGVQEVCWTAEDVFKIRATVELVAEEAGECLWTPPRFTCRHGIACKCTPEPLVDSESLDGDPRLGIEIPSELVESECPCTESLLYSISVGPGTGTGSPDTCVSEHTHAAARLLIDTYSGARFLDLRPSEMKDYVPVAAPELGTHGENLSAVVHRICQDKERKSLFLEWLARLCAPQVNDVQFDRTATGRVLVQLAERDGQDTLISAESVSDGTLRFMAVLAAMFTAPEGSLFLLEEIENGLHPTRVHLLVELLEQFAESRNLQIIGTTHSPQVLLSLSEQALRSAVLFARPEETAGTITRRLGDLPHFDEVAQKTQIDRLFTTGWLEQAL